MIQPSLTPIASLADGILIGAAGAGTGTSQIFVFVAARIGGILLARPLPFTKDSK